MSETAAPKASKRPVFLLRLRAEPHVADPVRALRRTLKILLMRCGLRCISCDGETP
jgi:hypothetical protein